MQRLCRLYTQEPHLCTRSVLNAPAWSASAVQRLRELDAGGASFLRSFSTGDCLLLAPSPEPGSEDQSESDELFFGPFDSDKGEAESSRPTTHN